MDAKELQELADRCRRLAAAETNEAFAKTLTDLANEYQDRALATGQQQIRSDKNEDPS